MIAPVPGDIGEGGPDPDGDRPEPGVRTLADGGAGPAAGPGAAAARLDPVLAAIPLGILVAGRDLTDVRANAAAAAILGLREGVNLVERDAPAPWTVYSGNEPLPRDRTPLARAVLGEEVRDEEIDLVFASGAWLPLLVTAFPLRSGNEVSGAMCSVADQSAIKGLERELEGRRRAALEAAIAKNRGLSLASHDARSSLNAAHLLAELLEHLAVGGPDEEEMAKIAVDMKTSIASVLEKLNDAVRLARTPIPEDIAETEFSLGPFLFEEAKHHFPRARASGIRLEVAGPPAPIRVRTDRARLAHVLGILIDRGLRATRAGSVRVSAGPAEGGAPALRVEDSGSGIGPQENEPRPGLPPSERSPDGEEMVVLEKILDPLTAKAGVQRTPGVGSVATIVLPAAGIVPARRPGGERPPAGAAAPPAGRPAPAPWWL